MSVNDNRHELIEEIEVPQDEDPYEYMIQLRQEVDLGEMCERSRNYG